MKTPSFPSLCVSRHCRSAAAVVCALSALPAHPLLAAPYQSAVRSLNPNFYYELNETSTDGGVIDSMGNATGPSSYNGDYVNGPPMVGGPGALEVFGGVQVPGVGGDANLAHYSNNAGHIILGPGESYGANAITVACFLKAGPAQGGDRIFTNNLADPTKSFQIVTANDGLVVAVDPNETGFNAERTLFVEDNSGPDRRLIDANSGWFHVVASTEGSTGAERAANIKVWINGIDRTNNLQPNITGWGIDTDFAKIGGRRDDPADTTTHSGAQDEVAIWLNRVLTPAEVATIWNAARRTPILSDNFNAPDINNFDDSDQTGRRAGLLGADVQLRSSSFQHPIAGNQLSMGGDEGRVRFHQAANLANWFDFAASSAAATILAEGGFAIEFDWTPIGNTSDNWVEVSVGIDNQAVAEPGIRVNHAGTDFGILFRDNGGTQYFDNGTAATGPSFPATAAQRHVKIEYAFTSFGDDAGVTANAWVDAAQVLTNQVFQWNGNAGTQFIEFGWYINNNRIDNFSIAALGRILDDLDADGLPDEWEQAKAGNLTDLDGLLNGPGPGAGTGNFDGDSLTDAQEFAASANYPNLDPKDSDSDDDGLPDGSEIAGAPPRPPTNPTDADSDDDGLSDAVENNSGTFVNAGNPGTNPTLGDTDGDHYPDGYEIQRGGDPIERSAIAGHAAGGIALGVVTDEASTGISASETYTHKISGGSAATVNGVALDVLDTATTPANFEWNGFSGGKNIIGPAINNADWNPAAGNVTGDGNLQMFGTFTYSGGGAGVGSTQRFTLSGLQAGLSYELRLYIRKWATSTVRPEALKFTNGAQVTDYFILEDRPGTVLGNGNDDSAYYIQFTYVAEGTSLLIDATVPNVASADGSFHMYGLTNRVASPPAPPLEFASIVRAPNGSSVTLTIASQPGRTYAVDYSTALTATGQPGGWVQLTGGIPSAGSQTVYVDMVASNFPSAFYRARDVTP